MGEYTITFKASVEKDFRKLPKDRASHILEVIEGLSDDPIPRGARKLYGTEGFYRVRAGDHRIIYKVAHEEREIVVFYVRHRSVAYRELQSNCPRIAGEAIDHQRGFSSKGDEDPRLALGELSPPLLLRPQDG